MSDLPHSSPGLPLLKNAAMSPASFALSSAPSPELMVGTTPTRSSVDPDQDTEGWVRRLVDASSAICRPPSWGSRDRAAAGGSGFLLGVEPRGEWRQRGGGGPGGAGSLLGESGGNEQTLGHRGRVCECMCVYTLNEM